MKFRIIEKYEKGQPFYIIQMKKHIFSFWQDCQPFANMLLGKFSFKIPHPTAYDTFPSWHSESKTAEENLQCIVKYAYKYKNKEYNIKTHIIKEVDLNKKGDVFTEML